MQQQRQLRLGDITDDYCPRERRLTNHAIVAMLGEEIIRTRCTTCDAEHEFKHAAVPRQRRKNEPAALSAPVVAAPKKVVHDTAPPPAESESADPAFIAGPVADTSDAASEAEVESTPADQDDQNEPDEPSREEGGWGHRTLIRAQLPKHEGQQTVQRQGPDFTIRQPTGGRPGRFPRQARGANMPFQGNRPNQGNFQGGGDFGGQGRGAGQRPQGGPGGGGRPGRPHQQHGQGRKRSK